MMGNTNINTYKYDVFFKWWFKDGLKNGLMVVE
jgi:hypothetical protein